MKTRIKIHGFLIFVAVVLAIIFYKYLLPGRSGGSARMIFDLAGLSLFFSGYFFRTAARGYKAELNSDGKTLVTKGPYAMTRNPMYLGTLCIGLGIILLIFQWWVAAVFLIIYLSIYIPQIKKEEKKLDDFFPEVFKNYCRMTPRFFPGIKTLGQPDSKIKFKFSWAGKELSSFLAASLFIIVVKNWALLRR
jgi:protein-S-isoprenylcysteine O-methyltransferase Ste14